MKVNAVAIAMRYAEDDSVGQLARGRGNRLEQTRELFLDYLLPVKKPLYNFVRKALNYSSEADDIFQEALLKGFRYFYSFDRRKSFKTWIFTIAHNLVKDSLKARSAGAGAVVSLEEAGDITGAGGPDGREPAAREVGEIYAVARQLPLRHREVFFLYYYNEFKISEIVDIVGLSRANVKFILYQARQAIKKVMEVTV